MCLASVTCRGNEGISGTDLDFERYYGVAPRFVYYAPTAEGSKRSLLHYVHRAVWYVT